MQVIALMVKLNCNLCPRVPTK